MVKINLHSKTNRLCLFKLWVLAGYYTLCIPFKPAMNPSGGYVLKTNKIQKILSFAVMWPLIWISLLTERLNYYIWLTSHVLKAGGYFDMAWWFIKLIRLATFFLAIISCQKRNGVEKLLRSYTFFPEEPSKATRKYGYAFVVLLLITLGAFYFTQFLFSRHGSFVSVSDKFDTAIDAGMKRFLLNHTLGNGTEPYTTNEIGFGVFELALEIVYILAWVAHCTLFFGTIPVTYWIAARNLETSFTLAKKRSKITILESFKELKNICESINSIWSVPLFFCAINELMQLMCLRHWTSDSRYPVNTVEFLITKSFVVVALIFMAESCRIVNKFQAWIVRRDVRLNVFTDEQEWEGILQELERGQIGIGLPGFYQVNYTFLSQFMVLLITLFAISFQ